MVDSITIQILRNRIASLMDEMHYHFYRSGYSTIVRESRDYSCVILDNKGRLLVAPPMFFHGCIYPHFVARVVELYGADGFEDGDVFLSNHPYEAGLPHVPDMGVVAPVIHDGELVGFSGVIAHKADVGGTVPGSTYGQATELFHEGLLLPPVKIHSAGVPNRDMERLIAANSRQARLVLGDLGSQVGVACMGRDRMKTLSERYGAAGMCDALSAMIEASAAEFRAAVARLPEGSHEGEGFLDSDGVNRDDPVRLHVRVTIKDGVVEFDFSGSADQCRGPVNLRPSLIEGCCFHALLGLLDPALRYSDAAHDVVRIVTPPRSVVNAEQPAPVSSYMQACQKLIDVVLEGLGPFRPERAIANSGGSGGAMTIAWRRPERLARGNQYEIFGSAYGAANGQDGTSGTTVHLTNILITPIEIIETEFPCRVTRFELIPGSGGAGEFRGGLSFRRQYELLEPATVIYRGDRAKFPPKGMAGGEPGAPSRFLVNPGTPGETAMPSQCRVELETGEGFCVEAAGGGGYGDVARRNPNALERDLREGYA